MKKILTALLALAMLLSLCACGGSGSTATEAPAELAMAGFGKADITPKDNGVPMGGYSNEDERLSTGLLSYIYAIAVAVTDSEGNTAIMMSVDNCSMTAETIDPVRKWAEKEYGIPVENILASCIHQHSTPYSDDSNYKVLAQQGMKDAIKLAMEDRAPAQMYINKVETEAMSFIRRAWYKDGGFVTSHSGDRSSGFDHYESEADKEMRLIKFTREDKADIIMVNFQGHPHMGTSSSQTDIHSDWPGVMRDVVEKELGALCVYFSGAGGNMNSTSYDKAQNVSKDFKDHGNRAAKYVIGAEDSYTEAKIGTIRCKEITNTYATDHTLDHLLDQAMAVNAVIKAKGRTEAKKVLEDYPELNSLFQVTAVVNKAARGASYDCTISAITFGDVAFTVHPYEMFDSNGKQLREGTVGNTDYAAEDQLENPFQMTFITTKSNGSVGYVPSILGFTNGGYERDTTRFEGGTGELLVGDYLHILNELHEG